METVRIILSPNKLGVWFKAPFNQNWIDELKTLVHPRERLWDVQLKMWWVAKEPAKDVFRLCQRFYGKRSIVLDPLLTVHDPALPDWQKSTEEKPAGEKFEDAWQKIESERKKRQPRQKKKHNWKREPELEDDYQGEWKQQQPPQSPRWGTGAGRSPKRNQRSSLASQYEVLGVPDNAPWADVKVAFKALARKYHPDLGGDAELMKKLNAAFDRLKTSLGK